MLQGVVHNPYGHDDLYTTELTERFPRDPMAGDTVWLNVSTTPVEMGQTVWVTWTLNGVAQPPIGAEWVKQQDTASLWSIKLGTFARGDAIEYTVHANENSANQLDVGPFSFNVTSWSSVSATTGHTDNGTSVDFALADDAGKAGPILRVAFPQPDTLHVQFAPNGHGLGIAGASGYAVVEDTATVRLSTSGMVVVIHKKPYRMSIFRADGHTLVVQDYDATAFRNLGWTSDGKSTITRIENHVQTSPSEAFTGFGERYEAFDLYGHDVSTFIYNEYVDQAATTRSYLAVPFFLNSAGYGVWLNTTATSAFNIGTYKPDMAGFTATTSGVNPTLDYYVFVGGPQTILDRYTNVTGRPRLPPKWAFGLWVSANEWNSQQQVEGVLAAAAQNQIPINVLVLEQWSDEATFYIWWGAQYTPTSGGGTFKYADFTFPPGGLWRDPKAMVASAHAQGVRIVLWQDAVQRQRFAAKPTDHYPAVAPPQQTADSRYAVKHGYVATDGAGQPYRIPPGWFSGSYIPDFTNPAATKWWMSKRAYLFDDVGIDGVKCDGGESVFGRNVTFADGRRGDVMHNAFPSIYIGAYQDFVSSKRGNAGVVFARAGSSAPQKAGVYWAGDQFSSFDGFQQAIRAGLAAGQSGVPFWGWDVAGFTGPSPSAELYLRAVAMAVFCPIFQLHSQWAPPGQTQVRMPWQIQAATGDATVVPTFRKLANVRMCLMPYIYSEARKAASAGMPMMRAMSVQFPGDPAMAKLDQQYMFGDGLLVAPIAQQGAGGANVYLPIGEWFDFWYSAPTSGPRTKWYAAGLDSIPVYAAPGAIIPLNLGADYRLDTLVGNSLALSHLTFRIYPSGRSSYSYFDDAVNAQVSINVDERWSMHEVEVTVPPMSAAPTLQIVGSKPTRVTVDGAAVAFQWDPVLQATLVALPVSATPRTVLASGIDKAAYQAEFATGTGTSVNQNHAGYTGTGFVDQFDAPGKSVAFSVWADSAATYTLSFRYANALGAASRAIYVDGQRVATLAMPQLASWDAWDTAGDNVFLAAGPHTIELRFDGDNTGPINLDSLALVWEAAAGVSVVTRHNNNDHSGANLAETHLTPANVSPSTFGHLYSYPVRGQVYAQPLYVSGLAIPGRGIRNVVFIATMHNQISAFDADHPYQGHAPLWQRTLAPSVTLPDPNIGPTYVDKATKTDTGKAYDPQGNVIYRDIVREVGILSTPVISRAHNTIYLVAATKDPAGAYTHQLHALDLATGKPRPGSPVTIAASVPGTGYTGRYKEKDALANGNVVFTSHRQNQRTALTLANDIVYFGFASYGDRDCYHGWVLAYDAVTLAAKASFLATPTDLAPKNWRDVGRGGVWQGGEGVAADDNGIYLLTSNGGYKDQSDYSDCFLRLDPKTLAVADWFTPFNTMLLAEHDLDVGSAGPLLVGGNRLIGGGKESKLFVIDRGHFGHFDANAGNGQILQHFYVEVPTNTADPIGSAAKDDGTGHHIHGSPISWQDTIYVWAEDAVVKAFRAGANGLYPTTPITLTGIPNAQLGTPSSQGKAVGLGGVSGLSPGMPGGSLSLSANGTTAGIVWACHPLANANLGVADGIVRAYDASDLSHELWNSQVNAARDAPPSYGKFCPPTVANGRVYVSTFSDRVMVYGLF